MDEGLSVGDLLAFAVRDPRHVLRHDGSPPLYYLLLHIWMSVFGSSEVGDPRPVAGVRAAVRTGRHVGWPGACSVAGPAVIALVLFALNPFITAYSQETRMYSLMALLGLLATAGFVQASSIAGGGYLILFAICQTLMLYTHAWGIFFGVGAAMRFPVVGARATSGAGVLRDAACWRSAAPRSCSSPGCRSSSTRPPTPARRGTPRPASAPRSSYRATCWAATGSTVALRARVGARASRRCSPAAPAHARAADAVDADRRCRSARCFGLDRLADHPRLGLRYFAPILGAILLLAALGLSRAGVVGIVALDLVVVFWSNPASYTPRVQERHARHQRRDGAACCTPATWCLRPARAGAAGLVLPARPDCDIANTIGPVADPQYMNWVHALDRLKHANPRGNAGATDC